MSLYRLKRKNVLFYLVLLGLSGLTALGWQPLQFEALKAFDFPVWFCWLQIIIGIYGIIAFYNWPLIFNSKFFPNFAMEYIENSFKTWVDDFDRTSIGSNELDVGLQLMELLNKFDASLGPTISTSFAIDIIMAVISTYACTSIAFKIGDATYLNYAWSAANLFLCAVHLSNLVWTYERGHKLQKMIQNARIKLEDACYKR